MDNLQEAYLSVYQELDEIRNPISRFLSNRKHKRRDTPEGHQEIMDRNREYQTKGKGPGGYRNKGAGRIEDTRKEEVDLFDYLLEYLVAEGYADTNDNAIAIMANMSEEWREEIVGEAYKDFPTAKVMKKAGELMGSSAGKTDEKSKKKEKRGIKMMDTMMQHSPD